MKSVGRSSLGLKLVIPSDFHEDKFDRSGRLICEVREEFPSAIEANGSKLIL